MRVKKGVETNMSMIEMTGFGREDGECLAVRFSKLSLSMREELRTSHHLLVQVPLQGASNSWVGYGSYYTQSVDAATVDTMIAPP